MDDEFDLENVPIVEFCVSIKSFGTYENHLLPTNTDIKAVLRDMLRETAAYFTGPEIDVGEYELSEKYGHTEPVICSLESDAMEMPRDLFDEEAIAPNPAALGEPADISHYFVVFRDNQGRKLVAVRRAAQFKGILKSKVIRWRSDALELIPDNVFKLDREFDFLITDANVYILHPTSFEYVAAIEDQVKAAAIQSARALGKQIGFLDCSGLETYASGHRRASRILAALLARDDLDKIDRAKLADQAKENGIMLVKAGKKIKPAPGAELALLELLDDRRYTTQIRSGLKEAYVASSRRRV